MKFPHTANTMASNHTTNGDSSGGWKEKYEQAIEDCQELKMKLGIANSVLDLARAQRDQARLDAAKGIEAATRDLKEELKKVKKDVSSARIKFASHTIVV